MDQPFVHGSAVAADQRRAHDRRTGSDHAQGRLGSSLRRAVRCDRIRMRVFAVAVASAGEDCVARHLNQVRTGPRSRQGEVRRSERRAHSRHRRNGSGGSQPRHRCLQCRRKRRAQPLRTRTPGRRARRPGSGSSEIGPARRRGRSRTDRRPARFRPDSGEAPHAPSRSARVPADTEGGGRVRRLGRHRGNPTRHSVTDVAAPLGTAAESAAVGPDP